MPFSEGYHAGLVNDRECPHLPFSVAALMWNIGNDIGVRVHCAMVEAIYLATQEEGI